MTGFGSLRCCLCIALHCTLLFSAALRQIYEVWWLQKSFHCFYLSRMTYHRVKQIIFVHYFPHPYQEPTTENKLSCRCFNDNALYNPQHRNTEFRLATTTNNIQQRNNSLIQWELQLRIGSTSGSLMCISFHVLENNDPNMEKMLQI